MVIEVTLKVQHARQSNSSENGERKHRESDHGPESRLLRDSNTSEVGGETDIAQTSSIGRR